MASIDLTVDANIPTGASAEAVVYEDVGDTGSYDNAAHTSLSDGTNTYSLSGFDGGSGNAYYVKTFGDAGITSQVSVNKLVVNLVGTILLTTNGTIDTDNGVIQTT